MNNIFRHLIFPDRCVACDKVLDFNRRKRGFCEECARDIRYAIEPVCKMCGKSIVDSNGELCEDCRRRRHYFVQSKGVYVYEGGIKSAMYRFKYSNRRCYKYTFSRDAVLMHSSWIKDRRIDAIVPVPMYPKKKRQRGYNQAEVIAVQLSKELDIPVYCDIVTRNRLTTPMKGLNDKERQKNLKNAFNFCKKGLQLKRVLLVDDIYTTGSTLDSVAKVLLEGGIKEVYGLCLCVGRGYSGVS
ncbi:MAG: ComF family protein [Lachnospiraceae bacterium]|nr:ComF family protein [Lachnospiraceae bacterium]